MYRFTDFFHNESGATAIEYGLIAALIAIAAIVSMRLLGINLANAFLIIANAISSADASR